MRFFSIVAIVLFSSSGLAQSKKATGLIFLDQGQYQSIPPAPPSLAGPPPAFVDLSSYGYFREPGNQGSQSSCVGWAVAYGLKSYQKNREYRLQNLQANFRFSPTFVYKSQAKGLRWRQLYKRCLEHYRKSGCLALGKIQL